MLWITYFSNEKQQTLPAIFMSINAVPEPVLHLTHETRGEEEREKAKPRQWKAQKKDVVLYFWTEGSNTNLDEKCAVRIS